MSPDGILLLNLCVELDGKLFILWKDLTFDLKDADRLARYANLLGIGMSLSLV